MSNEYYIIVWKDWEDKIHRNVVKYGNSKIFAIFMFTDASIKIPMVRYRRTGPPEFILNPEYVYPKPLQTVLYVFTVKEK